MNELEFLRQHLPDQKWRLNNLYHIVNENGDDVIFKMREAQELLYDNLHYRNIILKARQEGFTTFIDILALDNVLFTPNFAVEINAETKNKAADIFNKKIIYPYERLPFELKEFCRILTQTKDGTVTFSNGSSITVDVSARSGTYQYMHISEYGKVSAQYPQKADEIQTGSIPAVPKTGLIFIESTAEGNSGQFYDMCIAAKKNTELKKILSPLEFKFHFFPWWKHKEYRINVISAIPARLLEYFDRLYDEYGIVLDSEQQAWYAAQEATLGERMWREYPSYPEEAFKVAQESAFYRSQFNKIYQQKRIAFVPYEPLFQVYTGWDLGISDSTAIWFMQFIGREIRVIDYYENTGEGLPFYAKILRDKGYDYGGHFAPHDLAVRELGTGISRKDKAAELGINFEIIPTNRDVMGGIENVRDMLDYAWFDEAKTAEGVKALENYRKEWNDKTASFKSTPLHDWTSHGADAFRTIAVAWKMGFIRNAIGNRRDENRKIKVISNRVKI